MTMVESKRPSSADIARQIKDLLKLKVEERADAARLDELRRLFAQQNINFPSSSDSIKKWKAFIKRKFEVFVRQLIERMHRKTAVRTFWGVIAATPQYTSGQNEKHPFVSLALLKQWLSTIPGKLEEDRSLRVMVESEFLHQYVDVQYFAYIALAELAKDQYCRDSTDQSKAEVLYQLLNMLPRAETQRELDNGVYLFAPPQTEEAIEENFMGNDEDSSSDDEEEDGKAVQDDGDEMSSSDDDEEENKKVNAKLRSPRVFQYQQIKYHRKAMCHAWLAVLRLPLPTSGLKHALQVLPTRVLSYVPNPLRFSEFLVQAYNHDGVIPILALDGLFLLMIECGLEYPRFYTSLYGLIQPTLFYVKYRIRFFELLIKCLTRNEMLPAHIVAAFCKRLLRSCLNAPPSGCLFALALTSNLLRKHPECACLIHRSSSSKMEDKFDAKTLDPKAARALESSLWELNALEKHYHPAVATMASSVGKEDSKAPLHDLEDFLRHTYKSLFEQERKRLDKKRKKVPLTFSKPKALFLETDVLSGILKIPQSTTE